MNALAAQPVIFLVDIDAFFAQVEQILRPELRGRPVVVGGLATDRSVVASASYEARARGVKTAMPIREARRICPDAEFLRGDFHAYARFSQQMMDICRTYTPLVEPVSLDEAYLDVTGCRRLFRTAGIIGPGDAWPVQAADHLRRTILGTMGLEVTIGAAASRMVAKIACDYAKPRGLAWVRPGYEAAVPRPPAPQGPARHRAAHRRATGAVQPAPDRRRGPDSAVAAGRVVRPGGRGAGGPGPRHRPDGRLGRRRRPQVHQPRDHLRVQPHRPPRDEGHALLPAGAGLAAVARGGPPGPHGLGRRSGTPISRPSAAAAACRPSRTTTTISGRWPATCSRRRCRGGWACGWWAWPCRTLRRPGGNWTSSARPITTAAHSSTGRSTGSASGSGSARWPPGRAIELLQTHPARRARLQTPDSVPCSPAGRSSDGDGRQHGVGLQKRRRDGHAAGLEFRENLQGVGRGLAAIVVVGEDERPLGGARYLANPRDPFLQFVLAVQVIVAGIAAGVLGEPGLPVAAVQPHVPDGRRDQRHRRHAGPRRRLVDVAEPKAGVLQVFDGPFARSTRRGGPRPPGAVLRSRAGPRRGARRPRRRP